MKFKKPLLFSVLLFAALILTRCGKDNVCVAGIGNCSAPKIEGGKTTQADNGQLTLTSDAPTVKINQKVTFKVSGGTKPYTIKMYQGAGGIVEATRTEDSVEFLAPSYASLSSVRVYDAKNNYKTLAITVEE